MGGRTESRLLALPSAIYHRWLSPRRRPQTPRRVLVSHNLLLGDTLMLAPLFAMLREHFPQAEIYSTIKPAFLPLFAGRPYGITALVYSPLDPKTVKNILQQADFDLALVPGDNRYGWLAAGAGAKWIRAFAEDVSTLKGAAVDEVIPYPLQPAAWADMNCHLVAESQPSPYSVGDWPAPVFKPFALPSKPYVVLHVGASSRLKYWATERWRELANWLAAQGLAVVWSCGPGEGAAMEGLVLAGEQCFSGTLDLAQLWQLVAQARLLVCPDTGVAHLGKLTGTPTVTLFGPGAADIYGAGEYWRNMPYRAVTVTPFECRNQHKLFNRNIAWVQRCGRGTHECQQPRCMQVISVTAVQAAVREVL